MVSGRRLEHLALTFTQFDLFDCLVLENGGLLYWPKSNREVTLAAPPPPELVQFLKDAGAIPVVYGRVIVATESPFEPAMVRGISSLNLDWHIILNKGAVMALPRGVDKASGLAACLNQMNIPFAQVVGIGDAENDLTFLETCGLSVAVENALETVKNRTQLITKNPNGAGTEELISAILKMKSMPPTTA